MKTALSQLQKRLDEVSAVPEALSADYEMLKHFVSRLAQELEAGEVKGDSQQRWQHLSMLSEDFFSALEAVKSPGRAATAYQASVLQLIRYLGMEPRLGAVEAWPFCFQEHTKHGVICTIGDHDAAAKWLEALLHGFVSFEAWPQATGRSGGWQPAMRPGSGKDLLQVSYYCRDEAWQAFLQQGFADTAWREALAAALPEGVAVQLSYLSRHSLPSGFVKSLQQGKAQRCKKAVLARGVLELCQSLIRVHKQLTSPSRKLLDTMEAKLQGLLEDYVTALGLQGLTYLQGQSPAVPLRFSMASAKSQHLKCQGLKRAYQRITELKLRDINAEFACYVRSNARRDFQRQVIFLAGPTNSGKSYEAFNRLCEGESGVYLAPLRLLALEGQEEIQRRGHDCSLITGEEEDIVSGAQFSAQTIETLNRGKTYSCAVIDEIQMMGDLQRGSAFLEAFVAVNAERVILTGSANALRLVKMICQAMGDDLEVIHKERMVALRYLSKPVILGRTPLESGTAIVAFSRRVVLWLREVLIKEGYSVSVIYGGLSPLSRRMEARRFREGDSDILVATDAIGLGLNLPIKTVLFAESNKFDGIEQRNLKPTEIIQIGGRAGRYRYSDEPGGVGVLVGASRYLQPDIVQRGFQRAGKGLAGLGFAWGALGFNQLELAIRELRHLKAVEVIAKLNAHFEFENPWLQKCTAKVEDTYGKAEILNEVLQSIGLSDRSLLERFGFTLYYKLINAPIDHDREGSAFTDFVEYMLRDLFDHRAEETPLPHCQGAVTKHSLPRWEQTVKNLTAYYWFRRLLEKYMAKEDLTAIRSFIVPSAEILEQRDIYSMKIAKYLAS